jgi:hypothetical protein
VNNCAWSVMLKHLPAAEINMAVIASVFPSVPRFFYFLLLPYREMPY